MISSLHEDAFVESKSGSSLPLTVRKAVMHDIPPILDLINGYAAKGVMLPRTEFELSEAIPLLQSHPGRDPLAGGRPAGQDTRGRQATGGSAGPGGAGIRIGCCLRLHLRYGVLSEGRVPGGGARGAAAEGMEGLRAMSQIPSVR